MTWHIFRTAMMSRFGYIIYKSHCCCRVYAILLYSRMSYNFGTAFPLLIVHNILPGLCYRTDYFIMCWIVDQHCSVQLHTGNARGAREIFSGFCLSELSAEIFYSSFQTIILLCRVVSRLWCTNNTVNTSNNTIGRYLPTRVQYT